MKMLFILLALSFFAPASYGQKSSDGKTKDDEQKTTSSSRASSPEQKFVWEAECSGMKEVQLSEIALNKSKNPEVRNLAEMMVTDHGKANLEIRQLAERKNLEVPQTTQLKMVRDGKEYPRTKESDKRDKESAGRIGGVRDAYDPSFATAIERREYKQDHARTLEAIEKLEKASDQDFDRLYVKQMNEDHELAVKKFETASQELQDRELKQFAVSTLPILKKHLDHTKNLTSKQTPTL